MDEKIIETSLTFDDVLMLPRASSVLPNNADTTTNLTKKIKLKIPIISAAMDTVTESKMAIALAKDGGLGVIHKNLSAEEQAAEVDKVKRYEGGLILDPITIDPKATLGKAIELMENFSISGILVVEDTRLVGIVTKRDIRFLDDKNILIEEVMTKDKLVTSKEGVSFEEAKKTLQKHKIEKLPLVDDQNNVKGLITFKDMQKKIDFPNACKDNKERLCVGAAISANADDHRLDLLIKANVDVLFIDSAHGHHINIINQVKKIKQKYSDIDVVAGNIATTDAAKDLIEAGVDAIKVGIGPGSICTTRIIAGVGVPQVTAIHNVAKVCKKHNVPLIADGGIKYSGDLSKAIGFGADVVMLGSVLAGSDEAPGDLILYNGKQFKSYRGMGSIAAMEKGSSDRYFQEKSKKTVAEGIEGMVPYKGKVTNIIAQMVGGLRQSMGYLGVDNIKDMKEKTRFTKITSSGLKESHPFDIFITKEAPNYKPNN